MTRLTVVPSLLEAIVNHPGKGLRSRFAGVRIWVSSGEALTEELVRRFREAVSGGGAVEPVWILRSGSGCNLCAGERRRGGLDWPPDPESAGVDSGWKPVDRAPWGVGRVVHRRCGIGTGLSRSSGIDGGAVCARSVRVGRAGVSDRGPVSVASGWDDRVRGPCGPSGEDPWVSDRAGGDRGGAARARAGARCGGGDTGGTGREATGGLCGGVRSGGTGR